MLHDETSFNLNYQNTISIFLSIVIYISNAIYNKIYNKDKRNIFIYTILPSVKKKQSKNRSKIVQTIINVQTNLDYLYLSNNQVKKLINTL